jgi:transcription elongation factor Elf1
LKRLCFGSYVTVLLQCKARSVTRKQFVGEMLLTVNNCYDIREDDNTVTLLANGRNNLSREITLFLDDVYSSLSSKFSSSVLPLLDANKRANIVLAFKDILREDTDIADDTEIELLNHLTKADILKRESFVFCDLLAGMFLYVAKYTDNHDMKEYIKEITDAYIQSLDSGSAPITFIESYSFDSIRQIQETAVDAGIVNLMAEQEGRCPLCGKPLAADNCTPVKLTDNSEMLLCFECSASVEHSDSAKSQAMEVKKVLQVRSETRDAVSNERLKCEVQELLERLQDVSPEEADLRYTPLKIEEKVSDNLLRRKIRGFLTDGMYDAVNSSIENLAAENRMNVRTLSTSIRRIFEDANDTTDNQSEIFSALTNRLVAKAGQKYLEACELLVSYFVQRCEVFNEITE